MSVNIIYCFVKGKKKSQEKLKISEMQKKIRYRSICGVFKVIIEWSYNTNILLRVHEEKFKTEPVAHIPHKTGLLKPGLHYKTIREDG